MPESRKYVGSCHCGQIRYEVTTDLSPVMSCNCSICSRVGALRTFVPASQFKLLSGEDALSEYQFNKRHIHHQFCRHCGIHPFARGSTPSGDEMIAINVRCLEGVDTSSLSIKTFDGRSL